MRMRRFACAFALNVADQHLYGSIHLSARRKGRKGGPTLLADGQT
jgi:hypothetical protein